MTKVQCESADTRSGVRRSTPPGWAREICALSPHRTAARPSGTARSLASTSRESVCSEGFVPGRKPAVRCSGGIRDSTSGSVRSNSAIAPTRSVDGDRQGPSRLAGGGCESGSSQIARRPAWLPWRLPRAVIAAPRRSTTTPMADTDCPAALRRDGSTPGQRLKDFVGYGHRAAVAFGTFRQRHRRLGPAHAGVARASSSTAIVPVAALSEGADDRRGRPRPTARGGRA